MKYPEIKSAFNRDKSTHKFTDEFRTPELEYLANNQWVWTEKVDGMNIRVDWPGTTFPGPQPWAGHSIPVTVALRGRGENSQIPVPLYDKLCTMVSTENFMDKYPSTAMILYGEGFGSGIRSGGNYFPGYVDFVLFDVLIDGWWLRRPDIEDIAGKLGITVVPIVGTGTLHEAAQFTRDGFNSRWGNFRAEGIVLKPKVQLFSRMGSRIMTKMKTRDW